MLNDDISISASFSLKTPVIAPLDNFYECDNSTSIEIDIITINEVQTPSFQWYLSLSNPCGICGTNSSFTILGDPSSEGTGESKLLTMQEQLQQNLSIEFLWTQI